MHLTRRGKRRLLILLAITVFIAIGAVAFVVFREAHRSNLVEKARQDGMAAFERGDYEEALRNLSYSLSRNHDDLEALLAFAKSRSKTPAVNQRHLPQAINLYNAALGLDPDNLKALTGLLELHKTLRHKPESIGTADRILALSPDHEDALEIKAVILYQDERFEEAIAISERLAELNPQELSWRLFHIAALRNLNTDVDSLLALCDQWISEHERDGRFRLLKAEVLLLDKSDLEAAKKELIIGSKLGASSMSTLEDLLSSLERFDLRDEADQLLERTVTNFPEESWAYEAALRQHWRSLRLSEAVAELERAESQLGHLDHGLLRWKALLHAVGGEENKADETLDQIMSAADDLEGEERDALRGWAEAIRTRIHADEIGWADSIEAYARALSLDPYNAILLFFLAETYQRAGEHHLAIAALREAQALDRNWLAIDIAQAESFLSVGRSEDAFNALRLAIQRSPTIDLGAYVLLARAWLELGDEGDRVRMTDTRSGQSMTALDLLLALCEQMPRDPDVGSLLAEAHLQRGNNAAAVALIENALEDEDADAQLLTSLAEVSERWDLRAEERLLARAEDLAGLTLEVVSARARLLLRQGLPAQALALIDEAERNAPDPNTFAAEARELRFSVMFAAGDRDALADMTLWLRDEPDSLRAASFVLGRSEAWVDAELIQEAIDVMKSQLGEGSPRVLLAEAAYLQRFYTDDPASISSATGKVASVLDRTPDSKYALTLMATVLMTGDDARPDQAIRRLQHAIDLYSSDAQLYLRIIPLLQRQGDFDSAEQYLTRMALRCESSPDLQQAELQLLEAQGDYERAIERLSQTVDATSEEARQLQLASLYQRAGRHSDAQEIYQRLLQLPQRSDAVLEQAADFYACSGRFQAGKDLLQDLEPEGGEAAREINIARFCQRHGRLDQAAAHLQTARQLDAGIVDLWIELANYHLARGELPEARNAALQGLELDPANSQLKTTLAVVSMSLSESDRHQTMETLEELGSSNPALLATMVLFDRIAPREGATTPTDQDLADARQLVRDYPQFLPAWRVAVTMYVQADRLEDAIRLAKQAAARLPNDPAPMEMATRLLIEVGREDEAFGMARLWRSRSLDNPIQADEAIAALHMDLHDPKSAADQLEIHADRIVSERNRSPDRFAMWVNALAGGGQFERAAALVMPLLSTEPQWEKVWLDLALTSDQAIGRRALSIAEPHFLETPQRSLELAIAWTRLGQNFADQVAFDRAAALLDRIPEEPQWQATIHVLRAAIATGYGDFTTAEQHYESVLEHDPNHILALNNLAGVLVRQSSRCDRAIEYASRALELVPDDPNIVDTLAQALLCADQSSEAEQRIRGALDSYPKNLTCRITLATILHVQGRDTEAEAELEAVRQTLRAETRPDPSLVRRLEEVTRILADSIQPSASTSSGSYDRAGALTE